MLNKNRGKIWKPYLKSKIITSNDEGMLNCQKELIPGISERIKYLRSNYMHIDGSSVSQFDFFKDASRISYIENQKERKHRHKSFITSSIMNEIIDNVIFNTKEFKSKEIPKDQNRLPKEISVFWILFGDDDDLELFLYKIYTTLINTYVDHMKKESVLNKLEKELSANLISLLTLDAEFSLALGQEGINELTKSDNKSFVKSNSNDFIHKHITFTWDRISKQIICSYKNMIINSEHYLAGSYDSKYIDTDTFRWILNDLPNVINKIYLAISTDRIANLGKVVHIIMQDLTKKIDFDNDLKKVSNDDVLLQVLDQSNQEIIALAVELTRLQTNYFKDYYQKNDEENYTFNEKEIYG